MDSSIYIIRLLSREQHSVLLFRTCIASVAEIFYFFISFGIPYQVDPRKWDISSTHVIQHLKPSASCFSHESSIRTSNTKPDESNVIWSHLAHPLAAMAAWFWLLVNFLTSGQMSGTPPEGVWEEIKLSLVKRSCWSNLISGQFFWLVVKKPATPPKVSMEKWFRLMVKRSC